MTTKNDVILEAYQEIRVSGLTINPRPSDSALALSRLEMMMSEFFEAKNFNFGYNFEQAPDLNSETGVRLSLKPFMVYNLAMRLIPAFNKNVPQTLISLVNASTNSASTISAVKNIRPVAPPSRMPVGSGNRFRNLYQSRFNVTPDQAPISSSTNNLYVGETQDYKEDFTAWLEGNTIASVNIEVDPRLTLDSSSFADGFVNYTVTATDGNSNLQYIKMTVTDSASRVKIKLINFEVIALPEVP